MSKGDKPRPIANKKKFDKNWDRIFKGNPKGTITMSVKKIGAKILKGNKDYLRTTNSDATMKHK